MHPSNAWDGTGYFLAVFSPHNSSGGRKYCLMYQKKRKSDARRQRELPWPRFTKKKVEKVGFRMWSSLFLYLGSVLYSSFWGVGREG